MTGIVLYSWGPDASFDTHIDIFLCDTKSDAIYIKYVIYGIYDINDTSGIWHSKCLDLTIAALPRGHKLNRATT